jgi:Fic family protein
MARRISYIHDLADWPNFRWKDDKVAERLVTVRHQQGRLLGRMEALGFPLRAEATLNSLTEEVLKSSEIEGAVLSRNQVRSSIARRLGIDIGALTPADRHVEGVVEMALDATANYDAPLTAERLCAWHAAMFPTGYSGLNRITVGAWRDLQSGPMQVISGPWGHERVHFEAPAAPRLNKEMRAFLQWLNGSADALDLVLKAGIAHLWFVTIHPFDDGNGRIARAIADQMLARSEKSAQRFYSMSAQIQQERGDYYDILEATQKGRLDITPWLEWFLGCLERAFARADTISAGVLTKARFWKTHVNEPFNDRQRLIINWLLDGRDGCDGKLTTTQWAKLTKSSQDTALRDIDNLIERGIMKKDAAGGRSTSYSLVEIR